MKKDKLFMIISISVLVMCIIGSSYALYTKTLSNDIGINTDTPGLDKYINYVKGENITGTLNLSSNYTSGASSNIEFWKKDNTYDIYGKIVLTVNTIGTNLSSSPALKYALVNNGNILSQGTLQGTTTNSQITLIKNLELQTTKQLYTVYVWLDSNETLGNISGESINISVDCTAEMVKEPTFASYITNLYNTATKTTVTNNSITYNYANIYDIDTDENTSGGLMNDRLGSSTTNINGGNIRYYGASPNNYVYFNCSDYSNQSDTTCEVWRIIGVFNGKVKIIRNSIIGSLAWDYDKNIDSSLTTYDNNWSTSSLQVLLNEKYYNGNTAGTVSYYSGSDMLTSLNLTSIGLKNDDTRNMISTEIYHLRGENSTSVYSNTMYNYERITGSVYSERQASWSGKIALAYPSDYGYAVDLEECTQTLNEYNNSACASNNWMKNILGTSNHGWLLTPFPNNTFSAWSVISGGSIGSGNTIYAPGVAPVLSLDSELEVQSGTTGTSANPYKLVIGSN